MVIRNEKGERPESTASRRTQRNIDEQTRLNYLAEKLWEERQKLTKTPAAYLDPETKAGEISDIYDELRGNRSLVEILSIRYPEAAATGKAQKPKTR